MNADINIVRKNIVGLERGKVALMPHNPEWDNIFQSEKKRLLKALGKTVLDIQHVGSTAIPNISAKPIIDIAILVTSLGETGKRGGLMEKLGYYKKKEERKDRLLFIKGPEEDRMVYVHIGDGSSDEVREMILFRDHLLQNPAVAEEYMRMKQKLAGKYPHDRESYTAAKGEFIKQMLQVFKKNEEKF